MITQVFKAIERHLRPLNVDIFRNESFDSYGEVTQVFATGTIKELAIFPLGYRDLKYLGDGSYTFQDKKIFEVGSGTVSDKSIVHFDNDKYLIDGGTRRNHEGGFTTYIARRISDSS